MNPNSYPKIDQGCAHGLGHGRKCQCPVRFSLTMAAFSKFDLTLAAVRVLYAAQLHRSVGLMRLSWSLLLWSTVIKHENANNDENMTLTITIMTLTTATTTTRKATTTTTRKTTRTVTEISRTLCLTQMSVYWCLFVECYC